MRTMSEFYIISNELYHHGILGQKWGVRRYQNPDGSLTDAGRKRYASEAKKNIGNRDKIKNTEAYKKAYNSISKNESYDYKELKNIGSNSVSKLLGKYANKQVGNAFKESLADRVGGIAARDFINEHQSQIDDNNRKRLEPVRKKIESMNLFSPDTGQKVDPVKADKIATFGLKALNYSERDLRLTEPSFNPNDKSTKDWYLYEDQTIGYSTIADMVMRGYTKEKIQDTIKKSKDLYFNEPDYNYPGVCFDLAEGFNLEKYADACIEYKNKKG